MTKVKNIDINALRKAHWYKSRGFNSQHASNMTGMELSFVNLLYSTRVPRAENKRMWQAENNKH